MEDDLTNDYANDALSIDNFFRPIERVETNIEGSLKLAVLRDKVYARYNSWFEDIDISGAVAATISGQQAWFQLVAMRKATKPVFHPVYTVEELSMSFDVKFENSKIAYVNERKENVVVPNMRGYYILEEKPVVSLTAAHVSDVCAYYTRCPDKSSINGIGNELEIQDLKMFNIDVKTMRKGLDSVTASPTVARDIIFDKLIKKPAISIISCDKICRTFPDYSQENREATEMAVVLAKKEGSKREIDNMCVPKPAKILLSRNKGDIDQLYDFLIRSRAIRGNDKGPGSLSFGYVLGAMPRSVIKAICLFLDIRQLADLYQTNVILVNGHLPDIVLRMLVRNDYFVVSSVMGCLKILDANAIFKKCYGIYSTIADGIPYGIYYAIDTESPSMTKGVIVYTQCDIMGKFNMLRAVPGMVRFHALRAHMAPYMRGDQPYGFLPSALPHNGQVICVVPDLKGIKLDSLVDRSFCGNQLRNNWLITKRMWSVIDPYSQDVGYFKAFLYPRMRLKTKKDRIIYTFDEDDGVDVQLETLEVKAPTALELKPGHDVVLDVIYKGVIRELLATDAYEYVKMMVLNWENKNNFMATAALYRQGVTYTQATNYLMDNCRKFRDTISDAYDAAQEMIASQESIEPPAEPQTQQQPEETVADSVVPSRNYNNLESLNDEDL